MRNLFRNSRIVVGLLIVSAMCCWGYAEPETITSPSGIQMVRVRAGTFMMGSDSRWDNEKPAHRVTISNDFYVGRYEVTYELYDKYCAQVKIRRASPDISDRGQRPVEGVNWFEALKFCNWLSIEEGLTPCYKIQGRLTTCDFKADGYRLPTEAEWEFAARGGINSKGFLHSGGNDPDEVTWYAGNSNGKYQKVGMKRPNELGIYDMNGNMWEWCWDWYDPEYYRRSPSVDPKGPETMPEQYSYHDAERSRRGGRWLNLPENLTVSSRSADFSSYRGDNGIRLVRSKQ